MNEIRNLIVEFVAYHFPQSRQLLESMILPSWIRNGEIQQLQQSRESLLKTILISALFPLQRSFILAADVSELSGQRKREPATSSQIWMIG